MNKNVNKLKLLFLGILISGFIGLASFLFLILEGFFVNILWHSSHDLSHNVIYVLIICFTG